MPTIQAQVSQSALTSWVYNRRYPFPVPTHAELLTIFPEGVWLMVDHPANEYMIVKAGLAADQSQRAARIAGWQLAGYSPSQVMAVKVNAAAMEAGQPSHPPWRALNAIGEAHSANQLAAMSGTTCEWCAERLQEASDDNLRELHVSLRQAESVQSLRADGLRMVPDAVSQAHGNDTRANLLAAAKNGDYVNRCRTATGWREEVMTPGNLRRLDNDCRPLYIEGQLTDIDRFDRLDVDPRITSTCAYRSYWPRELIDRLTKLGNGPLLAVELRSTIKSDGSSDGRWFDSVELACGDQWCEVFVPYPPCDASPFGYVPWFVLGVGR